LDTAQPNSRIFLETLGLVRGFSAQVEPAGAIFHGILKEFG